MSRSEWLGLLGWANSPLALLNALARRLRASVLAPNRLWWEIEAWRAELAELTDLEVSWLWEGDDPFGRLSTSDRAPEPAMPQPRSMAGLAPMSTGAARVGSRHAASEGSEPAALEDARKSWLKSPHPSPDFPSSKGGQGRSSASAIGLAVWAMRRGKPQLTGAACTPIGQPRGSAESPYRHALAKALEDESLTAPPTGREDVPNLEEMPIHPLHRVPSPLTTPSKDELATQEATLETAAGEHEGTRSPFPPATGLLCRLADRWFAVHPGLSAPHPLGTLGEAAFSPRDANVAYNLSGSHHEARDNALWPPFPFKGPAQSDPISDHGQAAALAGDGHTAHMRWITPIAYNIIHLTVPSPPLADALDPDDLAELLDRILRQEARRYGIPL